MMRWSQTQGKKKKYTWDLGVYLKVEGFSITEIEWKAQDAFEAIVDKPE